MINIWIAALAGVIASLPTWFILLASHQKPSAGWIPLVMWDVVCVIILMVGITKIICRLVNERRNRV